MAYFYSNSMDYSPHTSFRTHTPCVCVCVCVCVQACQDAEEKGMLVVSLTGELSVS